MPVNRAFILFIPILCRLTAAQQPVSFLAPMGQSLSSFVPFHGAYSCPTCVATADFNGDGKPDVVYSGSADMPFAAVLLGIGDGTFRPGFTFDSNQIGNGAPPVVADFNGDGKPDVAFLDVASHIFLGHGDGTFGPQILVLGCTNNASTGAVSTIAVADLNRDGKLDLICGPTILLGNGDGTFRTMPTPLSGNVVLTADFTGDGIPDALLTTDTSNGILAVQPGRGDGTFGGQILLSLPNNFETPLPGDFNSDGKLDLAGMSGYNVAIFPGRGDGTFGPAIVKDSGPTAIGGQITAVADFNRDGNLDLVVGDAILAGNGDGTFRFPVFVGVVAEPCTANPMNTLGSQGLNCYSSHVATAVADVNGDGLPDLLALYNVFDAQNNASPVSLSVLLNDSPGDGFTATGVSAATETWPVAPNSLVSAFGANLAPTTESAASLPLPTTLGGIRVHLRVRSQAGDTLAPLLYVSPTQINYVMTASDPYAWVGIERVGTPFVPKGMSVPIATLAPGLFSLSSGLAAASAVGIGPGGQMPVSVSPIDLSGSPVYLSVYGTGFGAASIDSCDIAGRNLPATFAGPQGTLPGLDQVNILLPASLAGNGLTPISCTFGAPVGVFITTNAVYLDIR